MLPISSSCRHIYKLSMKKKRGDEIKLTTSLLWGDTVMPAMHHLFSCIFQTQRAQFVPLFVFSSSVNRIHLPSAPCTHSVHTQNLIFTKPLNETCLTRVQVQDTERELLPLPLLFFFLPLSLGAGWTTHSVFCQAVATRREEFQVLLMRQAGSRGVNGRKAQ